MDYLAIVKERAEGKDLSVLGGSVKFVADDTIVFIDGVNGEISSDCLLYTSPSPRDRVRSRMPSSA